MDAAVTKIKAAERAYDDSMYVRFDDSSTRDVSDAIHNAISELDKARSNYFMDAYPTQHDAFIAIKYCKEYAVPFKI